MSKLIYLASPYSKLPLTHRVKAVRKIMEFISSRFENTEEVIFSPILHSHYMVIWTGMDNSWEYWLNHNLTVLSRCDELWILCLDGWNESTGIEKEIIFAKENNILVKHIPI